MLLNQLQLNPDKTEATVTWGQGGDTPIIDGVQPPFVTPIHSLGVLLDPLLHLVLQVAAIARSVFTNSLW